MASKNVNKVTVSLSEFTERLVQRVTLRITANLQEDTPVDTGWARSNWVPSIGDPFRGLAGSKNGDITLIDPSPSETGKADVAANYKLTMGAVYISNNVPYILALNEGHSGQAPRAFVQADILKALNSEIRK